MQLKKVSTTDKPLLKRKHISAELEFTGEKTPSNLDTAQALAKKLDTKPELVAIRKIKTAFGNATATVEGFVYESIDDLKRTETKKMIKEGATEKEEAKPEAKPAAPKEEKAEEPKEAPKESDSKPDKKKEEPKAEEKPAEGKKE